jgi:hypothetical protein
MTPPALLETVQRSVSADILQRHLEWFSRVRRDTGGAGEDQAADYVAAELRAAGVPVTLHEFDAFLSYPIRATLDVLAPERMQLRCLTHSFARSTGPDGMVTDLVHLADGDVNRGAGRAALIDGLATPVTVLRASKAGCAAVIFANQDFMLRVSRVLNPVIYSQAGRFQHDPAEWSPIMRATSSYALAGLARAGALPALAGQQEYGFLRAQVVRERNRLVTALREATRLVESTLAA